MRARLGWALALIIGSIVAAGRPVMAQQAVTVRADALFYGDNTEFHNLFREGETLFGTAARAEARVDLNDRVTLAGGIFGNLRYGSESDAPIQMRPVNGFGWPAMVDVYS